MKLLCRAGVLAVLAFAIAQLGPTPAYSDTTLRAPNYYLGRADPRLCPSPACGGLWLTAVNGIRPGCRAPAGAECYVASSDLRHFPISEAERGRRAALITEGRAVAWGHIVRGDIAGFPDLDVLRVAGVWPASSSRNRPQGAFWYLRDRGLRCVTHPCFSIQATALNTGRVVHLSEIDLGPTGAPAGERRRARAQLERRGLIVAGRIVRVPGAGPAGAGRTLVASQFYVMASS